MESAKPFSGSFSEYCLYQQLVSALNTFVSMTAFKYSWSESDKACKSAISSFIKHKQPAQRPAFRHIDLPWFKLVMDKHK